MNPLPQIGLIADDFTGAMDSGAQFSYSPLNVHFRFSGQPAEDVEIISTASREMNEMEARARTGAACRLLHGRQLFKKIDSTLRGHIAAEIEAALADCPQYGKAVICSAAPQQGRTIRNGVLQVDGLPLAHTAFKDDPVYPARTSEVAELIGRPVAQISLEQVRGNPAQMACAIRESAEALVCADAETEADLLNLARAICLAQALPCGSFGLAKAFLAALDVPTLHPVPFSLRGRVLLLAGSANRMTRAQIGRLEAHPECCILRLGGTPDIASLRRSLNQVSPEKHIFVLCADQDRTVRSPEWLRFGKTVSETALELLDAIRPETVFGIGGETVAYFCQLLQTGSIEILGESAPGIPFGRMHSGRLSRKTLITKAGGFGRVDSLESILFPEGIFQ